MRNKTFILIILSISVLLFSVACTEDGQTAGFSTEQSSEQSLADSAELSSNAETYNLNGRVFKVMQRERSYNNGTVFKGEVVWNDTETGELNEVDLAKKEVLDKVQKELNCTLTGEVYTGTPGEFRTYLEDDILSGAPTVDFFFETPYYYTVFLENGYLADLGGLGVDLSADWWDNSVTDLSVDGKAFYAIGDISTYDDLGTFIVLFNKRLYSESCGDVSELYSLALKGEFTFDFMGQKAEAFGNGERFGLLSTDYGIYLHFAAAGERMVGKMADGNIGVTGDNERAKQVYSDSVKLYKNGKAVLLYYRNVGLDNPPNNTLDAFKEGKGLFYITTPQTIELLGGMEDEYGILPLPKYNEEQKEYCGSVSTHSVNAVFVPKTDLSKDEKGKEIGVLLDSLGKYGKEIVSPVVVQTLAPDTESANMLELAISSRIYDFALDFSVPLGDPTYVFQSLNESLSFDGTKENLEKLINSTFEKIKKEN